MKTFTSCLIIVVVFILGMAVGHMSYRQTETMIDNSFYEMAEGSITELERVVDLLEQRMFKMEIGFINCKEVLLTGRAKK